MKARITNKNKKFLAKLNVGLFKEVIGQGTAEKRNFGLFKGAAKINFHKWLNLKNELSFSISSESELTKRGGDVVSSIDLYTHQLSTFVNAELVKNFFVQASYKQFNANGNEFLTQRNNYGNITYFTSEQEIDQKDHLLSAGILYKFRENVYANINYNWWGSKFTDQQYSDYKYNRLIFILSIKL